MLVWEMAVLDVWRPVSWIPLPRWTTLRGVMDCGINAFGYHPPVFHHESYTYGIFKQRIVDGYQAEFPDYWLNYDNPWEIVRHDVVVCLIPMQNA